MVINLIIVIAILVGFLLDNDKEDTGKVSIYVAIVALVIIVIGGIVK